MGFQKSKGALIMAAKKKAASAADAAEMVTGFAVRDHVVDDAVQFTAGQKLTLGLSEFEALEAQGAVERGVLAKMLVGVEGGKYSLKPRQEVFLPPPVFEAWCANNICEKSGSDVSIICMVALSEELRGKIAAARAEIDRAGEQFAADVVALRAAIEAVTDAAAVFVGVGGDEASALAGRIGELSALVDGMAEPAELVQA